MKPLVGSGAKFLVVGAISTAIELAIFNLLVFWLHTDPVLAKVISSLIALINAYFGNREWAFRSRRSGRRTREIVIFLLVNAACTALGAGIVAFGVAIINDPHPVTLNLVNIFSVGFVVIVRFVLYHFVVFPAGVRPSQ